MRQRFSIKVTSLALTMYQSHNPYKISILLLAVVLAGSSCEKTSHMQEYEEIIITPPLKSRVGMQQNPHVHTPSAGSQMSGDMKLPAGQNTPQMQRALDASVERPPLSWKVPSGWTETKGSGMRLVTFRTKDKDGAVECSIISLSGQAGGLQSNVVRWMRQIKVVIPVADELKSFLADQKVVQAKGNFSVNLVDLTTLPLIQKSTNIQQTPSMIAAIAELPSMTIFVKMTGSRQAVLANKGKLESLIQSLTLN